MHRRRSSVRIRPHHERRSCSSSGANLPLSFSDWTPSTLFLVACPRSEPHSTAALLSATLRALVLAIGQVSQYWHGKRHALAGVTSPRDSAVWLLFSRKSLYFIGCWILYGSLVYVSILSCANCFNFILLLYSRKRDLDAMLGWQVRGARARGPMLSCVMMPILVRLRVVFCALPVVTARLNSPAGNTTTACWPAATEFKGQHSSIVLYSLSSVMLESDSENTVSLDHGYIRCSFLYYQIPQRTPVIVGYLSK
jgi:hypothetical protein